MQWRELSRITPGMFLALEKQRSERFDSQMLGFQFLATVVARLAGDKDANFMPESSAGAPHQSDPGTLEAFFRSRAAASGS